MEPLHTSRLKDIIHKAFAYVVFPGEDRLVNSLDSSESIAVRDAFASKKSWKHLDAKFLDRAPNGLGSALNFFSREAFQFYLPAYMLADIDGNLKRVEPDFSLCFMFNKGAFSNPRDPRISIEFLDRNSIFDSAQCAAIAQYLTFTLERCDDPMIRTAIDEYWRPRSMEDPPLFEDSQR